MKTEITNGIESKLRFRVSIEITVAVPFEGRSEREGEKRATKGGVESQTSAAVEPTNEYSGASLSST